jgi:hypothetical protein
MMTIKLIFGMLTCLKYFIHYSEFEQEEARFIARFASLDKPTSNKKSKITIIGWICKVQKVIS